MRWPGEDSSGGKSLKTHSPSPTHPPHALSFLLVRRIDSDELVGFVNFRFDLDDGIEVLYW